MGVLIADSLLLLSIDDIRGTLRVSRQRLRLALAGAFIGELGMRNRVATAATRVSSRRGDRLTVLDTTDTGDLELNRVLVFCSEHEGAKVKNVVAGLSKGLDQRLLARLADTGVVGRQRHLAFGIIPTTRWPIQDHSAQDDLRLRLRAALINGTAADAPTAILIAMLQVIGALPRLLPDADPTVLRRQAQGLSAGVWAADGVQQALHAHRSGGT